MKTVIKKLCFFLSGVLLPVLVLGQELMTGKVSDPAGKPVAGATIKVKGTEQATVTATDGTFRIRLKTGDVLVYSFVGYKAQEVTYRQPADLSIQLETDSQLLEDVVVVGYGSQKKQEITGSVATVQMEQLTETQVSESFESMLQGRVAGVNIQLNSGEPGASPTIIIRGLAAVSRDDASAISEPLYVVDGVPIISRSSDEFAITSTNVLSDLNPSDIEDVVVLKDAYASAIYGSRAANGVILITTRKGKRGKPQIDFNARNGINFVPQLRDVAGGLKEREQVLELYDRYAPYGVSAPGMYTDITNPFYNNSSDWQGYLYNTSMTQDYNGSIRGAGDFGQYSVSLGYMDNRGILFNSGFKRYSAMTNTSFNALNNRLVISNTLAFSRTDQQRVPDALTSVDRDDPAAPKVRSSNFSSLLPLPNSPLVAGSDVYGIGYDASVNDRIRFSPDVTLTVLKNLVYKVSLSLEYTRAMQDLFNESRRTLRASNSSAVGENANMLFQNTLTYSPRFGNGHGISFLVGQSAERIESRITKVNSVSDAPTLSQSVNWPAGNSIGSSDHTAATLLSYFSRVDYAFQQRYLFGASLRADGSSKFGQANRWGIFPSVSAGWNFSNESFLAGRDWLKSGKLRGSYGVSGTTWDNNYLALGVMDGGSLDQYSSLLEISYGGISGFTPTWYDGFKNQDLTWVKSQMTNIGLDLSLFDDRIGFVFDAYEKLTKGLLLTTSLPTTSGYNEVYRNAADVLNRGLEFTVNTTVGRNAPLRWDMGLNFALNQNRVVALPDGNADIVKIGKSGQDFGNIIRVGNPLNGFFFYESQGIYQTEQEIPVNPNTGRRLVGLQNKALAVGDRMFRDQNGDYRIDVQDRVYAGDPNPRWTGGWTNDFTYRNFSLNVVSAFVLGRDVVNTELLGRLRYGKGFAGSGSLPDFDNYAIWERSGDLAKYPTLNPWNDASQIIDYDSEYLEDGSYFKIKTVTLSYRLDRNLLGSVPLQRARVYCTLDNLVTFQRYSGPDAELMTVGGFDSSTGYPMRRMMLFGISFGL